MAPAGWVSATVTNKRHVAVLKKLLAESHELYPAIEVEAKANTKKRKKAAENDGISFQIDKVMGALAAEGLRPMDDDGFDD